MGLKCNGFGREDEDEGEGGGLVNSRVSKRSTSMAPVSTTSMQFVNSPFCQRPHLGTKFPRVHQSFHNAIKRRLISKG